MSDRLGVEWGFVAWPRGGSIHFMESGRHLLLYDGVCGLCNHLVDFVVRHDRSEVFHFAPIQSPIGSDIMRRHGGDPDDLNTVAVLLDYQTDPVYLERGDAVVALLTSLGGRWRLAVIGKVFPRSFRDWVYSQVALRRYRRFGLLEACALPTPGIRSRFVDDAPIVP